MDDRKEAEKAYHYLAETDEEYASAKALKVGREHAMKTAYSIAFLDHEGTVAERQALAYASQRYKEAVKHLEDAVLDYETLHAKRERARLAIERWRTLEATRRTGSA